MMQPTPSALARKLMVKRITLMSSVLFSVMMVSGCGTPRRSPDNDLSADAAATKQATDELLRQSDELLRQMQEREDRWPPLHPQIRQKYVEAHPKLRSEFAKAILDGEVCVGMTPEDVKASWGNPRTINSSGGEYGSAEQWCYHDSKHDGTYLYFRNGALTSWQVQRTP